VTRVPGKPGWIFDKTGIYRKVATRKGADGDADDPPRYDQLTDWAPTVERYVVGKTVEGETIRTRYTVRVGDQTQTFSQDDLRDGRAWDNFHQAAGQGDRQVAGALADIVRLLGRDLGETVDCPMWEGDQLVMPPADLMPSGYEQTGHEMSAELLGIACDNPKLALVLGFLIRRPVRGSPRPSGVRGPSPRDRRSGQNHGHVGRRLAVGETVHRRVPDPVVEHHGERPLCPRRTLGRGACVL
jgi:hypothetical protein